MWLSGEDRRGDAKETKDRVSGLRQDGGELAVEVLLSAMPL
jgi:hypothetical protein